MKNVPRNIIGLKPPFPKLRLDLTEKRKDQPENDYFRQFNSGLRNNDEYVIQVDENKFWLVHVDRRDRHDKIYRVNDEYFYFHENSLSKGFHVNQKDYNLYFDMILFDRELGKVYKSINERYKLLSPNSRIIKKHGFTTL